MAALDAKHLIRTVPLILLLLVFGLPGCSSIGPTPALLSAELGNRIAEMEGLHEVATKSFFDSERGRVDEFLERDWIPLYVKNLLGESRAN